MRFALACPDQHREHQEAPEHLEGVFQNLTRRELPDELKVGGKALDLAWEHRAHCKDAAHAERLAQIPGGTLLMPHWINLRMSGSPVTATQVRAF